MKKRFQRTLEIREMQRQTVVISNSYKEKTRASKSTKFLIIEIDSYKG